jgi:hypothetical protein
MRADAHVGQHGNHGRADGVGYLFAARCQARANGLLVKHGVLQAKRRRGLDHRGQRERRGGRHAEHGAVLGQQQQRRVAVGIVGAHERALESARRTLLAGDKINKLALHACATRVTSEAGDWAHAPRAGDAISTECL